MLLMMLPFLISSSLFVKREVGTGSLVVQSTLLRILDGGSNLGGGKVLVEDEHGSHKNKCNQ